MTKRANDEDLLSETVKKHKLTDKVNPVPVPDFVSVVHFRVKELKKNRL
jgi:hypothetical protein